jgi:hypothetical protein
MYWRDNTGNITLKQILSLVGKLDDTPGEDNPRERFRLYLKDNVNEVGQVRDYIEESLRTSGSQYNRAFQDLVNYLGYFLGFEIKFGRYQGVQGQIGFDGLWKSPSGFSVVAEVKTTEVYAIKTATLMNYIDEAISEKIIKDRDHVLGLYIVGRSDPDVHQLENAIYAEKRMDQLRVISAESLLSLAELMNQYDVSHDDILAVLRPSGPIIDPIIDLMARLAAESEIGQEPLKDSTVCLPSETASVPDKKPERCQVSYWLSPVIANDEQTAEEVIQSLVGVRGIYAFGERTPGRKHLKTGDMICFYAAGNGVVGHAKVASYPEKKSDPAIQDPERYPWLFSLEDNRTYIDSPIIIDAALRAKLDAFKNRDSNKAWSWFVFTTRKISENDFKMLTGENFSKI